MDWYFDSPHANHHQTVKSRKIKFHDADADDPDWRIKQCILLLIAGVTVVDCGVSNLWKSGRSCGLRNYADFGQYFDQNGFKAFCEAIPYMWSDEKHWYRDKRDVPWDLFMPFIGAWNGKQRDLFHEIVLVCLDESMVGWCPKTSKLGGLPNFIQEPRKPVPLGSMLKDAAEATAGIMLHVDPVMLPEVQAQKEFSQEASVAPNAKSGDMHQPHIAETLRLTKESGIKRGGYTVGDAWFGSVGACIALKKKLGVESSFIIKNNSALFPKAPLRAVLKARHGQAFAGNWVVFTTTIDGVDIIAMVYGWSNEGVSYFVSTVGDTTVHGEPYLHKFESAFGGRSHKCVPRNKLAHQVYETLPVIDVFNKL